LRLHHCETGESFDDVYWTEGRPVADSVARIDWLMRDFHVDECRRIDLSLLHRLSTLQEKLETDRPFEIFSGFRSARTNQRMIARGERAAAHSFHIEGMAADFRVPNRRTSAVYRLGLSLGGGGTGFYPRRGFVHFDSGPTRRWMGA
jgi:uncharacterized protein YcbK (DUF882 family)